MQWGSLCWKTEWEVWRERGEVGASWAGQVPLVKHKQDMCLSTFHIVGCQPAARNMVDAPSLSSLLPVVWSRIVCQTLSPPPLL